MNSFKIFQNQKGFTLVELMVVLVIIGLMMGGFFSAASVYMQQKQGENMQVRFNEVRASLADFILDDPNDATDEVRYPCPASLTAAPGDPGFGQEVCPSDYASVSVGDDLGGVFVKNGSTLGTYVLIGAVPAETLGVKSDLMFDEFGNRFTYAVTMNLTMDDALLQQPVAPGQLTIVKDDGSVKTSTGDFTIVSHGKDGAGSYTPNGQPNGTACRVTGTPGMGDSQNCMWQTTDSAIFKERSVNAYSTADNDNAYDDMAVHTLAEDDGWWQATGGAGSDIVNKNPANIGIGPAISVPMQRLDIDGAIKVANTANVCNAASVGSIRYNNGSEEVVECCNADGAGSYSWRDIGYGCSSGVCNASTVGQMRPNPITGIPEYCNGTQFVPTNGADCGSHYHGEVYDQEETETRACDNGKNGEMTRSRINQMVCMNSNSQIQTPGNWSGWDRTKCVDFPKGQPFTATCTSKAGRTQSISARGNGDTAVGRAPSNQSTWVVYKNGPYLNCFDGAGPSMDFYNAQGCRDAGKPGYGKYLASCTVR